MQALFYIGLFGTFFFVMSSITAGVARTTFQQQLDREDRIVEIFKDVEYAINRVMLRDQLSLANEPLNNMNYVLPHLSWSSDDVATDPWARPVTAARIDERQVIAAFGGGERAEAVVSHFALISGGPDREIQTAIPGTVEEWRVLHSVGGANDDIVHTFSTRDPMMETWNAAAEVEKTVAEILRLQFRQRVEQFYNALEEEGAKTPADFTNCALLNQTDNSNGYECGEFDDVLIRDCNAMYQYGLALEDAAQDPDQDPPNRPQTTRIPDNIATIGVNQCWRYESDFKEHPMFPTMAGNNDPNGGQRPCEGQFNCPVDPSEVGVFSEVRRDPFGGFGIRYSDNNPSGIVLERNFANFDGWTIVRNNRVDAD